MKKVIYIFAFMLAFIVQPVSAAQMTSGETVSITIKGVPASEQMSITGEYVVDSQGLLFMPMLKAGVKAAGSSSSSVARRIENAYKEAKIYSNPRITIITRRDEEINITKDKNFVTVAGHVKRPGKVPYTQGMTIYEAVANAGDKTTFGAMNRVEVIRNGKKIILNLRKSSGRTEKVRIGDMITVPEKNAWGK